jgi:hypothetical protein
MQKPAATATRRMRVLGYGTAVAWIRGTTIGVGVTFRSALAALLADSWPLA